MHATCLQSYVLCPWIIHSDGFSLKITRRYTLHVLKLYWAFDIFKAIVNIRWAQLFFKKCGNEDYIVSVRNPSCKTILISKLGQILLNLVMYIFCNTVHMTAFLRGRGILTDRLTYKLRQTYRQALRQPYRNIKGIIVTVSLFKIILNARNMIPIL